jgi:hypothetical protein
MAKILGKEPNSSEGSGVNNPLRQLRKFLKSDRDLKDFATQRGFAELVECSLGLVQAVEQGVAPVSKRLARSIERRLGVNAKWLQKLEATLPIPAVDGSPLTTRSIKDKLESVIAANNKEYAEWVSNEPPRRIADALGVSVRDAQVEAELLGDYQLVADILRALNEFKKRKEAHGPTGDSAPRQA